MSRTIRASSPSQTADFFRRFFGDSKARRYVFGRNEYAEAVAGLVDLDGFIDDFSPDSHWLGKPVCKLSSVAADSLVVSCVTASFPVQALCRLAAAGIEQFADYFSIADASGGQLPQVRAIIDTRDDYRDHASEYAWVRQRLNDEVSRDIFDRLLDFRLTGSLQGMTVFEYAAQRQYFEPFLGLGDGEVFVDGGGFDGYTSEEFAKRSPGFCAIHLFEPSASMLEVAKTRLAKVSGVTFHPLGLYDRCANLSFDSSGGSASRISENGSETIRVDRLDDAVDEAVSFIKLDLEGAELQALDGARRHILADHPKLAVAVYHRASDFWRIPRLILGLRDDYKIYLRHYTEGWTETVMFFVPLSSSGPSSAIIL